MAAPAKPTLGRLPPVYERLVAARNAAADEVLLSAVAQAAPEYRRFALEALLARGRESGLIALVGRFDKLAPEVQQLVVRRSGELSGALRRAIEDAAIDTRRGAIALIRAAADCQLAYLLADALCRECHHTRELAAEALAALTAGYVNRANPDNADALAAHRKAGDHLAGALRRAINAWDLHFRTEVLSAALWLTDRMEEFLLKKCSERRSKIARALGELLAGSSDPRVARFALCALPHPALRSAAAGAIGLFTDADCLAQLADAAWLLADPTVRRACGFLKRLSFVESGIEPVLRLQRTGTPGADRGGDRIRGAVRLVGASGFGAEAKVGIFAALLGSSSATARDAAFWELLHVDGPAADELLRCAMQRTDRLSRLAGVALRLRHPDAQHVARGTVQTAAAPIEFEKFWNAFDRLSEPQRLAAMRAWRRAPARIEPLLRERLAAGSVEQRVRALKIVTLMGRGESLADSVVRLCHDADGIVRSAAVAALAVVDRASAAPLARRATADPDPRVRANAVELLDALDLPDRQRQLEPLLRDRHQRVRANAIKSLLTLQVRQAAESLVEMLQDPDRSARISALWVIERLRLGTVLARVERLAADDDDPHVRRRAQRVRAAMAPRAPAAPRSQSRTAFAPGEA